MKQGTHPQVFPDAKTTCISCGAVYLIPTTVKSQQVEVCSACHPIYTGEYRGIIASGRVDRFRKHQAVSKQKQEEEAKRPKRETGVRAKIQRKKKEDAEVN